MLLISKLQNSVSTILTFKKNVKILKKQMLEWVSKKGNPALLLCENANWYNHYGEQYGSSLKNLEIPYDPAIPLLGMYLEKIIIPKDTCIPMFIAAPFTTAEAWKQSKCPLKKKWIKKTWYKYCCSAAKSCLTLCYPKDCSPPGSSVHEIFRQEYWH